MKLPCEMVQDLLPLYHDNVCSKISETLLKEHLSSCENCRKYLDALDEELEVPKLEIEKAKPLEKIQASWKKQTRQEKIKYVFCGAVTLLLLFALWWSLTNWCVVPLKAEDYVIKEASQLENGMIHIRYTLMYDKVTSETEITEEGILVENYRRPILAVRRAYISKGIFLDPEDLTWFDLGAYSAYCLGDPDTKNSVLIWKLGMELPPANQKTEETYKDLKEAYAAPNAPEEPDIISVIEIEPTVEIDWYESDSIEETVVSGANTEK